MNKYIRLPLTLFTILILVIVGGLGHIAWDSYSHAHIDNPVIRFAMKGMPLINTAYGQSVDILCDGTDDHVQWRSAANSLSSGGKLVDLCGTTYYWGAGETVTFQNGDIHVEGVGGGTYFDGDNSTAIFSDGGYDRCLFTDLQTDAGGITCTGTDSYRQNVWIAGTFYFEGVSGGAGCNDTIRIVVSDSGTITASGCGDTINIEGGTDITTSVVGDVLTITYTGAGAAGDDVSVDSVSTTDPDFQSTDDIDFINTANVVTAAINTDVIVAGDFADADWGDITISSNVAAVEDDSHLHTGTTLSGIDISDDTNLAAGTGATLTGDTLSVDLGTSIETGEITDGTIAEADLDIANAPADEYVLTWEVGSGQFEWEPTAGDDMGAVDTEAELEAALTNVSDVFTDNDGALDDDDVSLSDVQTATTSDFHNIGGTDDDVPESGDFGAGGDLDADGTITDGVIDEADFDCDNAPVDEYVLTYESSTGNFEWEADQAGAGGAGDDVFVDGGNVTDPDFVSTGDIDFVDTANTITANLNEDVIVVGDVADGDWGDFTVTTNVASLDAGVVSDNEIDYSQVTFEDFDYQSPWEVYYSNAAGDVTGLSIGANNTVLTSNGIAAIPEWRAISGDDMGSIDTEAELESTLTDVSDVFTNNDGALDDDDVTLADVQSACTNDFHNIGGVDDERTQEEIEDFVGDMLTGNTETRITVTYQDADGTIDFIVDDLDTTLTQEEVEDYIGGLINDPDSVQTRITVTYDDTDNALDFIVDDLDTTLSQEQVDDYVAALINDADSAHTRVTITYDDADDAYDFVVDDMNDDVPEAGDFGNAADLDANGEVADDSHNHTTTTISGLDISADTNLAAGTGATLTDDTISVDLGASIETGEITDDEILEADLDATNSPTDNYYLTYDLASGGFTWVDAPDTTLSQEEVDDYVDALINDGDSVHTRITITYDDADNAMDFVVDDMNDVYTAGDALTLTGNDFDFDGGAAPGGELGGTWANPTVDSGIHDDEYIELGDSFVGDVTGTYDATVVGDDSHNHTTTTVSGLDISDDTNLAGGTGITLTDDTLSCDLGTTIELTEITCNNWKVLYSNGSGVLTELSLGGNATFLRSNGASVAPTFDDIDLGTDTTGNYVETVSAGSYVTVTGADSEGSTKTVAHTAVLRNMPQMFACSISGNSSTAIGDCEQIDFNGMELHVREMTAGNTTGMFHFRTPADFGYGGNTTLTVAYGIRVADGSSGSALVMRTKVGTSTSDVQSASWNNSANLAFSAVDEIHWTADEVIDESLSSGEQDIYIICDFLSEDWDSTAFYWDKFQVKAWGV